MSPRAGGEADVVIEGPCGGRKPLHFVFKSFFKFFLHAQQKNTFVYLP